MDRPVARTQMLIRRPAAEVFKAFVDPAVTTRFWFTRSSGRLEPGAEVVWHWDMYGVSAPIQVKTFEPPTRLVIEWDDPPCPVEWLFSERPDGTTFVTVANWGFQGSDDEVVAKALDSTAGFTMMIAGLKAFLEHGIELNLTGDCFPDGKPGV